MSTSGLVALALVLGLLLGWSLAQLKVSRPDGTVVRVPPSAG